MSLKRRSPSPPGEDKSSKKLRVSLSHSWQDGDFTLVSSDDITFRIDTHYLQSASGVFRDMLAAGSGPKLINLTDPHTETALVVHKFLNLITTNRIDNERFGPDFSDMVTLVRFLIKYECAPALTVIGLHLHCSITEDRPYAGLHWFIVGAIMDDIQVCITAFDAATERSQDPFINPCFNPSQIPYQLAAQIPFIYFWALVRTWDSVGGYHDGFVEEFEEYLELGKRESSTTAKDSGLTQVMVSGHLA
ncbi:hypothetical protein Q8F55_002749 [Vanrija albida]|uniref:BTB domain-containing protein n=1 Tax=Vanrija albida TaxID=181172 RepID=A0ABR3QB93_9TREE